MVNVTPKLCGLIVVPPLYLLYSAFKASLLMPLDEQHREGIKKWNQPAGFEVSKFHQTNPLDKLNPQVETDFNRSGRIDAPRAYSATQRWLQADEEYKLWLKNQEGAEFIRNTPLTMINHNQGK